MWPSGVGTISFALFGSLFSGYDVKRAKNIKNTAVNVLFALWLIFHMLKITTPARSCEDTDSHTLSNIDSCSRSILRIRVRLLFCLVTV